MPSTATATEAVGANGQKVCVETRLMETVEFGFNRVTVESPVVDEHGEPVLNTRGKMQADKAKTDTEDIPPQPGYRCVH